MSLPVVRKVGPIERYSLSRSNTLIYMNVVVGTRLVEVQKSGTPAPLREHAQWVQLLTGPLTWLIQEHPVLSTVVGDRLTDKPVFLQMPSVDLSRIIRVTTIDHAGEISKVLEEEHSIHYDLSDTTAPLWRIVVAQVKEDGSFFLLYNFQHSIADGRGALGLTEQLVERLNIQAAAEKSLTLPSIVAIPAAIRPLPAFLEERVDCSPGLGLLIKEATMSLFLPSFIKKAFEKKYWAGEFDATLKVPTETGVLTLFLTKDETAQVVQASKAHKTSVHSILLAAAAFATKLVFLSDNGDSKAGLTTTNDGMKLTSPVSLRPLLPTPITPYVHGNYTSEIASKVFKVKLDTGYWDLVHTFRKQLIDETTNPKGIFGHVGLLGFLPKKDGAWEEFLCGQVEKEQHGRESTLQISNLGIGWKQQESEESLPLAFKVQEAVFSQDASITATAITFSVATANGVLSITSTWQKSGFKGRDRLELHMKEFKRILLQACEPNRKDYRFREVFVASPATNAL
ncbi:hypothetical protein BGX29_010659 [Mortierella sp. GBA35]|nr:hypothetical protein BGX29_010659 [Mortierella sp. GBA35]